MLKHKILKEKGKTSGTESLKRSIWKITHENCIVKKEILTLNVWTWYYEQLNYGNEILKMKNWKGHSEKDILKRQF